MFPWTRADRGYKAAVGTLRTTLPGPWPLPVPHGRTGSTSLLTEPVIHRLGLLVPDEVRGASHGPCPGIGWGARTGNFDRCCAYSGPMVRSRVHFPFVSLKQVRGWGRGVLSELQVVTGYMLLRPTITQS